VVEKKHNTVALEIVA